MACGDYECVDFRDMTLDTIRASNFLRNAFDAVGSIVNATIPGVSYACHQWLFRRGIPAQVSEDACEDFSGLPWEVQPKVPVPRRVTLAAAAVMTARPWEEDLRDTVNSRILQELKKENIFPCASEVCIVQVAIIELMRRARIQSAAAEIVALKDGPDPQVLEDVMKLRLRLHPTSRK
jgi:hypothetical protein